ncbi:gamma-interferon-inducible lysosomal thiol reductase-like isoform X2 [Eriocheir sinensis]|uniref:gamma-interferon-inducible lysosomal thiol reductase-like isoform X2 n=1 Tax=Eriocheir sinensis TaxID=95602 RepID=UPI0021C76646|nr:gamma-interferon-inducible lysosomal thiol reductase-like isoform X2 [Eriocheir sinensis]
MATRNLSTLLPKSLLLLVFSAAARPTAAADPVKVSVYYETLCPDSRNFFTEQLYPVYQDLKDIMTLDINTYGKATDFPSGDSYVFVCQHGHAECVGNMMITCAKNLTQDEEVFMAFSNCVMAEFTAAAAGPQCAEQTGVNFAPVEECYNSVEGHRLLHEVGVKQNALEIALYWVPWILIDDVFTDAQLEAAQLDLRKVVCDAYTGERPAACTA